MIRSCAAAAEAQRGIMRRQTEADSIHSHATASGNLAGVGAILLWCFSGVCCAVGARAVGAMPYLCLSCAVGVLTVAILRLFRCGSVMDLLRVPGRVIVAGFFGVTVYSIMLVEALGRAQPADLGVVLLLNYLWPVWMVLLGLALLDSHPRPAGVVLGAIVGFAGLLVARGIGGGVHRPTSLWPHAMTFVGGLLWALYSVMLRRWRIPHEKGGSTFHFFICAVLAALIALLRGEWALVARVDAPAVMWIIFGGVGPVGLGYYWWEIGIKRGSVQWLALLAYLIPIGSTVLIGLFFKEAMSPWLLAGAAMIAAGAWMGRGGTEQGRSILDREE